MRGPYHSQRRKDFPRVIFPPAIRAFPTLTPQADEGKGFCKDNGAQVRQRELRGSPGSRIGRLEARCRNGKERGSKNLFLKLYGFGDTC